MNSTESQHERRSTRIPVEVSVEIELPRVNLGVPPLPIRGYTTVVSLHGALIHTSKPLRFGTQILVTVHNGRGARLTVGRIVYIHPTEPQTAAVELLEPQNVWGVSTPPADWN